MDHSTHLSRQYPWRTTALLAAGLAAFELLLLVIIVLALFAKPFLGDDSPSRTVASEQPPAAETTKQEATAKPAKAEKAPAPTAPTLDRDETLIIVLNGNGSQGAAAEKADLVRTKGYMIAGTENAPRTDFSQSVVMFRPGHKPEATRLARDFGIARVSPLDGLGPADLQGAHVALIVGAE